MELPKVNSKDIRVGMGWGDGELFGPGPVQGTVPPILPMQKVVVPEPIIIRDYQETALFGVRDAIADGSKRVLLVLATGLGKTVVAAQLVKWAIDMHRRVLFIAHRRELVNQCAAKLERFGVPHGVVMAGIDANHEMLVQVASVQTLWMRGVKRSKMELPQADILIIDEAHRSRGATYEALIRHYTTDAGLILGLTATPCRADGKGLGNVFNAMVMGPSIEDATKAGHLVPVRYFGAKDEPDLAGIKTVAGDYHEGQLAQAMDKPKLVGDIVEQWGRLAANRQTVVFATSVQHSIHLTRQFVAAGVKAEHLDGNTPTDERDAILRRLERGETQVVCNCEVLIEGWDCPPVSCVALARPTKSVARFIQMCGRTLRPFPGKTDCIVLDHAKCVLTHGRLSEFVLWSLDSDTTIQQRQKAAKKKTRKPIKCQKCQAIYSNKKACPECGHVNIKFGQGVTTANGDLVELADLPATERQKAQRDYELRFYSELLGYCKERGWNTGAAAHKFKTKFGKWPRHPSAQAVTPGAEIRSWIRSQNIAWSRSRNNPANRTIA